MHVVESLLPFRLYWLVLAAVAIEMIWYLAVRRRAYPWRELLVSVGVMLIRIPGRLLLPIVVLPVAFFVYQHRMATVPVDTWWALALLFLGVEFCYYWAHRLGHEVRWLWASHSVHHSPEHLHLGSAFRLGATEVISGGWLVFLPLYLLGFHPLAVAGTMALNLFYQFWIHTDLVGRLGPLEWVLNTPSHHRVHHGKNEIYLDRNFGGVLIIWDRLFGTFTAERDDTPVTYGLLGVPASSNPVKVTFREWLEIARDLRRTRGWRQRLRLVIGPPGATPVTAAPDGADIRPQPVRPMTAL